jgi:hypothetical protein
MPAQNETQRSIIVLEALAEACALAAQRLSALKAPDAELQSLIRLTSVISDYTKLLALDAALECSRGSGTSHEFLQIAPDARQQSVRIGLVMRHTLQRLRKLPSGSANAEILRLAGEACTALSAMATRTEELFRPLCQEGIEPPGLRTRHISRLAAQYVALRGDATTEQHLPI